MDLKISITTFSLFTISSLIYLGTSADADLGSVMGAVGGGSGQALPCLPKLLPCQKFLGSDKDEKPTSACCDPLKDIIEQETKCLCDAFQNPTMFAAVNVTKDDIVKLPKYCSLDANEDICKSVTSASSGTSSTTPADSKSSDSSNTPSSEKSSKSDSIYAAKGVAYMSRYSITALVVALIVSA